jgi:O-antigen ligase
MHHKLKTLLVNIRTQRMSFKWILICVIGIAVGLLAVAIASFPSQWIALVVFASIFTFAAIISGNIRRFLLALILFDIPFRLDIHLGFREEVGKMGALGGWNLSITTIALIVLYLMWFLDWLNKQNETEQYPFFRASLPLAVYLGFTALSIIVAKDLQLASFQLFLHIQLFLLFIYIIGTVRSRSDILFIVTVLSVGLVLESVIMIGLHNIGHPIEFAGIKARIEDSGRIGGTVGGPNTASAYISLVLIPAMSLMIANVKNSLKWLGIITFGLGIIAIVLTLSRGGWIAFVISSLIFIFVCWFRGWLPLRVPIFLAVVTIALLFMGHEMIVDRIFGYDHGAAYVRIPLMKLAFRMIYENPFLGVGANNFPLVMHDYISSQLQGLWLYSVHNKYLLIWAETGLGGLLAFFGFLLTTLRKGWKSWQVQDPLLSPIGLGLMAAIMGHMVHMNFDTFQNRSLIQALWVISALIAAIYNKIQYEKKQQLPT